MCGRFTRKASSQEISQKFEIDVVKTEFEPSYNIAPTQAVAAIVQSPKGKRGLVSLKWGLIPSWSKDASVASKLINARSESAHEKPSFRDSLRRRRCLIVASGFYEWQKGSKQPMFIHFEDQPLFAFAGLYDFWQDPAGQRVDSCTILTTQANPRIAQIHERMPVVLKPADYALWLDATVQDPDPLQRLLHGYEAELTAFHAVTPEINKVSFNQPEAILPWAS